MQPTFTTTLADRTRTRACIFRRERSNHHSGLRTLIYCAILHGGNHAHPHETPDQDRTARQHRRHHPAAEVSGGSRAGRPGAEIQKSLGSKGAGAITIPGLVKIEKKQVPARPAQKGVPNPFKPGELMDRPAKPASNKVKVRALKTLKEMAK